MRPLEIIKMPSLIDRIIKADLCQAICLVFYMLDIFITLIHVANYLALRLTSSGSSISVERTPVVSVDSPSNVGTDQLFGRGLSSPQQVRQHFDLDYISSKGLEA